MLPNFSESFVEFCNRVEQSLPTQFTCTRMTEYNGRIAALSAEFSTSEKKKLMGLMPTKQVSHCHEFRLVYAVPVMDLAALEEWWEFARGLQKEIVPADPTHEFSMVSLILVAGEVDPAAAKKLKSRASELRYSAPQSGWSSVRVALVDLGRGKIHVNRMGGPLRDLIKKLV